MTRRWPGLCPALPAAQREGLALSPSPAPAGAPVPPPSWHRGGDPQPGHLCPGRAAGPASQGFSYPLSQQLKFQPDKSQPQTYSKHLLVFKENNSVKGTELCLKPYAFSFLQAYLAANSTWDKTSMFFSQRFGIKDSLSFLFFLSFFFPLFSFQFSTLSQDSISQGLLIPFSSRHFASPSIFIPEQGSSQMQSKKETFIPWLLS